MGLYDYFFGPSVAEKAAAQRAAAQRAAAQRARAQRDAQARLCQSPTQKTGTLPCGLPIKTNPCDLKDLKITERKNGSGEAPWVGTEPEPKERSLPAAFFLTSRGTPTANPYITGSIIEVTAGAPKDFRKTSIDILIEQDYQFCSQETHPHLVVIDPLGKNTTLRGARQHSIQVFRKSRGTDEHKLASFIDIWPIRWGFQDYRISALVCGMRKAGPSVRSQNTTIRVYPSDQWEFEIKAPSLLSGSIKHGTNTWNAANPTSNTTVTGTANTRGAAYTATGERSASGGAASYTGSAAARQIGSALDTRLKVELKRDGVKVLGLDWIVTAINALKDIEKTIKDIGDAIKKFKPKVGWDFSFGVEVLAGSLKATWGFKENLDRQVFFAYSVSVKLTLIKVSFSVSFGVDLTIRGYGFIANIEGKIDGSLSVSAEVERKSIKELEWQFARFKTDFPASLTARGMAIHDRVLSLSAGAESGFESDGKVGFDPQGFGVQVTKIEFKGVTLKGRATVISLFDVDVDYKVMQKRKVGGPLRFPG
jgi:hypothetical protein